MTPASKAALRNAADMLDDAVKSASQDWLFATTSGKNLRKARRMVDRLLENESVAELDSEEDDATQQHAV